ncbi:hypothetical protein JYP52_16590 [Nitratireductor aquibiodomus]|uniref:class I SAM-dependent methyltransferase n=1 Tax=Nitratireductor aquibiodomus TaxID=204799 RepID=UPI0019D35448|nr:class I SAM-dependent methyltransferase [Nitratireductor aquibiodomus]MBN7762760.1 hypothetical protein [Nitratireductor aquibiodomus]
MTFDVGEYWEKRYRDGGNSGAGSYGRLAEFKAEVINSFIDRHQIQTVLDLGCGDGNQLSLLEIPSYIGADISEDALERCRRRYGGDASKAFHHIEFVKPLRADLTLSLDVIYHLVTDGIYESYMTQLFGSAKRFVMVYSTNHDERGPEGWHLRHRRFTDWVRSQGGFELLEEIPNRYPPKSGGGGEASSPCSFFIFKRTSFEVE